MEAIESHWMPAIILFLRIIVLIINKKILQNEAMRPLAVQIDYADWLEIGRLLAQVREASQSDVARLDLTHSPLFGLWRTHEDCWDVRSFVDGLRQGRF